MHRGQHSFSGRQRPARRRLLLFWIALCASILLPARAWSQPLSLFGPPFQDTPIATYDGAPREKAPQSYAALPTWLADHQRIAGVNMTGGHFWLVTHFTPPTGSSRWVVALANTYFEQARIVVLGDKGMRRKFDVGQAAGADMMFHKSVAIDLQPGHRYAILAHISSPFYTALPRLDVQLQSDYQQRATNELVLALGAFGLLGGLGTFILFVGLWTRNCSFLLYGLQTLILMLGWSFYFGLPHSWLGISTGRFNFTAWFILLPIAHALFTIHFLGLRELSKRLQNTGYAIAAVSALALPVSLLFPSQAFFITSVLLSTVVMFTTVAGIWAVAHGVRSARFFILAYLAVLVPILLILPANFGLVPVFVDAPGLLTLLGNGCASLILAFALADHIRLVENARERFRRGMQEAINQASTDPMTGLGNRLAFDIMIEEITSQNRPGTRGTLQIAVIDLDGLKRINDTEGHHRGDALLCTVSDGLRRIQHDDVHAFRLGGDEFAVIAFGDDLGRQRLINAFHALDKTLNESGFANTGISYGICSAPGRKRMNREDIARLVREADNAMYTQKSQRQVSRASGQLIPG